MAKKVSSDMPQKVLDLFNTIDFNNISILVKKPLFTGLKIWVRGNLPLKKSGQTYQPTGEKKQIAKDFDEDLLTVLNTIDYNSIMPEQLDNILKYLINATSTLPHK